jgi:hypothetical protein
MLFLVRLGIDLIKEFKRTGSIIFLVIFSIIIINMAKAGGGIGVIFFWLFFAFLIGHTLIDKKQGINIA